MKPNWVYAVHYDWQSWVAEPIQQVFVTKKEAEERSRITKKITPYHFT